MAEKSNSSKIDINSLKTNGGGDEHDNYEIVEDNNNGEGYVDEDKEYQTKSNPLSKIPTPILIGIGVIVFLFIAYSFFGSDSESDDVNGETKKGVVSSILSFGKKEEDSVVEEVIEGDTLVETIMLELQADYEGYEIINNTTTGLIEAKGVTAENMEHHIFFNQDGTLNDELLDGVRLSGDTQAVTQSQQSPVNAPSVEVIQTQSKDALTGEELVTVKLSDFNKTNLSVPLQNIVESYDEYGNVEQENYTVRYIVQYEKMPLRGKIPSVYSVVIETGEKIIFNPTFSEYMKLEQTGTTVLEIDITKMHGVEVFDRIRIYEING